MRGAVLACLFIIRGSVTNYSDHQKCKIGFVIPKVGSVEQSRRANCVAVRFPCVQPLCLITLFPHLSSVRTSWTRAGVANVLRWRASCTKPTRRRAAWQFGWKGEEGFEIKEKFQRMPILFYNK